ncbi:Phage regulatory protein Rha [compost metagenome]
MPMTETTTASPTANTVPTINPEAVRIVDGLATTTSLIVAESFGKLHRDVLRRIASLDCSPEFTQRNFAQCSRPGANNKPEPYYRMTRDGFTFLCMGFTGKEAARWKEAYINAFNAMETELQRPALAEPSELLNLTYESRRFRIVRLAGEPWFVAADLAQAIGLRDSHVVLRNLQGSQCRKHKAGKQLVNVVSLSGLHTALLHAKPAQARAFREWIEQVIGAVAASPRAIAAPTAAKLAPAGDKRWLLSFDANGEPQLQPAPGIPSDEALLQWLADPQGASPALLATMLHVIATRLGEASHG